MGTHSFPFISTKRCLLRGITVEDLSRIYAGLSNPEVIRYYGVSFDSLEATRYQMEWYNQLEKDGTGIWWAITSRDKENFFGAAGLNNISKEHLKGEIGFWLMPDYWGQGIMREIVPEILNHCFETLNLHRIEGIVEHENVNCKKLMERLGFQHEGTMKECEIKNGRFISLDMYAMIKRD
tara:strand:+ start:20872 stop:21411 length:540 start_codon:yes stop_codon:yes gene_type:complete